MKKILYTLALAAASTIFISNFGTNYTPQRYTYTRKPDPVSSNTRFKGISQLGKINPAINRTTPLPQQTWQQSQAKQQAQLQGTTTPQPSLWQQVVNWFSGPTEDQLVAQKDRYNKTRASFMDQYNKIYEDINEEFQKPLNEYDDNKTRELIEKQKQLLDQEWQARDQYWEANEQLKELKEEEQKRSDSSWYNKYWRDRSVGTKATPQIMKKISAPSQEAQTELAKTSGDTGLVQKYRLGYGSPAYKFQQHLQRPLPPATKEEKTFIKSLDGSGIRERYEVVLGGLWDQTRSKFRQWFSK